MLNSNIADFTHIIAYEFKSIEQMNMTIILMLCESVFVAWDKISDNDIMHGFQKVLYLTELGWKYKRCTVAGSVWVTHAKDTSVMNSQISKVWVQSLN